MPPSILTDDVVLYNIGGNCLLINVWMLIPHLILLLLLQAWLFVDMTATTTMVRLLLLHSQPQLRRLDGGDCAAVSHFSFSRVAAVVNEGLAANEGVTFLCKRQIKCRHHRHDQQEHCLWMEYPYYLFFSVVWWCVWRAVIIRSLDVFLMRWFSFSVKYCTCSIIQNIVMNDPWWCGACAIVELVFHPTRISILICLSSDDTTTTPSACDGASPSPPRTDNFSTKFVWRDLKRFGESKKDTTRAFTLCQ